MSKFLRSKLTVACFLYIKNKAQDRDPVPLLHSEKALIYKVFCLFEITVEKSLKGLAVKFGSRFIDDISVAEVNDYLTQLYYVEGRAYRYVEGFLKMFYLILGQAYSRNYLDVDTYNKLCVNKDVRITMPKMKIDEETDIVAFSREETDRLDAYFKGSNAETACLLGKCCGLRINECYGLKRQQDTRKTQTRKEREGQQPFPLVIKQYLGLFLSRSNAPTGPSGPCRGALPQFRGRGRSVEGRRLSCSVEFS